MGFVVAPGELRVIEVGGQVEKKPAELAAFATLAEIRTEPGWLAVAIPFGSMATTAVLAVPELPLSALY